MLLSASTREVELTTIEISDINGTFSMSVEVTKVDKGELLSLDNPHYQELITKYHHLLEVNIDDTDTKSYLPLHVILGTGEYAKLKTN